MIRASGSLREAFEWVRFATLDVPYRRSCFFKSPREPGLRGIRPVSAAVTTDAGACWGGRAPETVAVRRLSMTNSTSGGAGLVCYCSPAFQMQVSALYGG
jgi:hypothetical protein